ncbi:asparagine--tRNA ligase, cytoplasmic 1-like [Telopea speciosissima]|uniref:asparagine--tRNA ligase, cytoplasmic 1-like n=1 Tax=Telopea speciosissima TaxID=54955 RepID=UPI001CC6B253|nr:asparagine--tRNA ligase, cytoplasmic 1-like [Telopea speciosissima]XP_043696202.1 asparagine--tRNA ligase, cytoplasmic 1-like [Telopea speciosissima]
MLDDDASPSPPIHQMATATLTDNSDSSIVPWCQFSRRVLIRSIVCRPDGGAALAGQNVTVGGWVKTGREQGKGTFAFLELNDGSCSANLQVIVDGKVAPLGQLVPTGTCVHVEGELKKPPEGTKQSVELRVEKVLDVGPVDPAKYPLPKTKLTLEFLRDFVHLRPRTNTISAVARIRNALAYATHTFFQKHGFIYVHTPIITTSDCEGAGEMFQVTTLLTDAEKLEKELKQNPPPSEAEREAAKLLVKEKGDDVSQLKSEANKEEITASVAELSRAKENLERLEERSKLKPGLPEKDGKIDYSHDFFARQAFLTVSGQLQVEGFACALSSVYTFGPTFRAEHSHTSRHLAEFWMVEPEIAFADLEDDMNCAEAYVKFLCQWLLENCLDDMKFMVENFDKAAIDRLKMVTLTPFERISYTHAVKLLESVTDKKFENKVEWGIDLSSEHERYLTEIIFKKPVIVYNYPKGIKAFYMRLNDDMKTVAAMDVLVPKVGELVGGSQREERYEAIQKRILEMGLPLEPYEWYLDLRRYGTIKHCGFGLGFERMVLFATGIDNIRDVIPFPRYPGRADL